MCIRDSPTVVRLGFCRRRRRRRRRCPRHVFRHSSTNRILLHFQKRE